MYCEKCGEELNREHKFCVHCGESVRERQHTDGRESSATERFPWHTFFLVAFIIAAVSFGAFMASSPDPDVDEYVGSDLLHELEPTLQPLGYFSEPSFFEAETLSSDDWLSYVEYTEPVYLVSVTSANSRFPSQFNTFSSVVKIVCEDEDYYYYGSGTNLDSAGYVVTNLHVIEGNVDLDCVVGFPDPETGLIREAYWATPIIDNESETGHDLAMLSIEAPVFDEEYNIYGFYEKFTDGKFPHYEETDVCLQTPPQLGGQVFVLGYPSLSGGALTITDGLISSLYSTDGYLITSAKISRGNSGGLAVDDNNCFVGVPTAVYFNEQDENYGEIIDAYFVYEFLEAMADDLAEYAAQFSL